MVLAALLLEVGPAAAEEGYTLRGYDARLQQGIDLIYGLRFGEAERHFAAIIAAEPDNPLGYFLRAMVAWWQVLIDLDSQEHDARFYALLEECIRVCDRRLEKDPLDFDAILCKGGAIGFRGRLRGDRGEYLKAAGDGLRCLPLLEKSRKLEPTNKDILFGQGLYNYFAQVMPERHPILRPVMVFLPEGDRQLGLAQLKEVARQGMYARSEAAYFLAQIYRVFEDNKLAALHYLEELYERYPDNALFHRYTARTLADLGRWERAVALYEEYVRRSEKGQAGYHVHGRLEAHYYLGKHGFFKRRYAEAERQFAAVDSLGRDGQRARDQAYVALANLYLGMAHDAQGRRSEAVARYQRVLSLPAQGDSRELAGKYLREPYRDAE
jgi:hypothetical protein